MGLFGKGGRDKDGEPEVPLPDAVREAGRNVLKASMAAYAAAVKRGDAEAAAAELGGLETLGLIVRDEDGVIQVSPDAAP
jgi:hypothetical protein